MNHTLYEKHCMLCPRKCGADRTQTAGFCGGDSHLRAARAALHFWEEPCISGENGSGAVFFSGCSLRCCFCQNQKISTQNFGTELSVSQLAEIFQRLQEQGANNINLVTGTHFTPWILDALELAKPKLHIPILWNSSGYESPEALRMLDGYIDIYLPDLKYISAETAKAYSGAADYFPAASAAILEMFRQTGKPVWNGTLLKRGLLIRHLILPGHRHESMQILHWLAEHLPLDGFLLSLMGQYTPPEQPLPEKHLNRRLTTMEYRSVLDLASDLGFQGYSQELCSAKQEYTPDFNLEGLQPL